jgi:hypothetical protein
MVAHPNFVLLSQPGGVTPFAGGGPTGYTPAQIRQAYGFNQISFNGVAGDGTGTTIAIVDAYDDPKITSDLHQFDTAFGLSDPTLVKMNQTGGSTMPPAAGSTGWDQETSLDVEWAHAIAPKAKIILVESNDDSFSNLLAAVQTAAKQSGVVAVSMSWGGGEFSSQTSYDSIFTTPSGHGGVTFLASSGDSGAPVSYPASSPNVVSVGGTTLSLNSSNNILSESGWGGSGGGISAVESQPSYQHGVVTQTSSARANPDVAYDADPNTGFPVYDTYSFPTSPWQQFGGTSDAAPQWAALVAIADQGRALAGEAPLDGASQTLPKLYSLSSSDFHDVTSGTSTGFPQYHAGSGYDLVTGRGSPVANKVVADLVGTGSGGTTHFSVTETSTDTAGNAVTVTVKALDANNNVITNYAGTIDWSSTDPIASLPGSYTFTSTDKGVHTFSVTLKTAGSETVTVTDHAVSSVTGSATTTVSPAAATKLGFGQQPTNTVVGAAISPAVTVLVLDTYGNIETSDSTDSVTVAFGNNPGSATLGGTHTVTVKNGVATFSNLTVSALGTGYTLKATSGTLTSATSASFNVTQSGGNVIEDFESSDNWYVTGSGNDTAYLSTAAAHDGTYGLDQTGPDWLYRTDSAVHVKAGDTMSVWLMFAGAADGRAYFGFGASDAGTLSLVAAPNTNQLILQSNPGYGFSTLAAVSQTFAANHWYRLEVDWSTTGSMIGKLFDSNGTTLLRSVSAKTTSITSGGIALRAIDSDKYWDTITDTHSGNSFAQRRTHTIHAAVLRASSHNTDVGATLPIELPPWWPFASQNALAAYYASVAAAFSASSPWSAEAPQTGPESWASWFQMFG